MNRRIWIWGCLLLGAGCVRIDVPVPVVAPGLAAPAGAVLVDVTCVLPAAGPAVERGVLVARLYEYDPRIADGQAREIGRTTLPGVSHRPGGKTVLRFSCAGKTAARKAYYLTAVVYPEGAPADRSGLFFIDGFQPVLAAGNRETLRVTLSPVAEVGEPTN